MSDAELNADHFQPAVSHSVTHPGDRYMKVPSFGPLETVPCGLCESSASELITIQRAFGENFHVVRCTGCGLMRTNPRPSLIWRQHYHDPDFNSYIEANERNFVYAPAENRIHGYQQLLAFLKRSVPRNAKLLDVGCAAGLFVNEARNLGFDAEGCDRSENAIAHGRDRFGVRILHSSAEAIDVPDGTYDVVTILHVFEHLPDPMAALRELLRILKPGGLLLLETVNYVPHFVLERRFRFLIPLYNKLTKRDCLPWVPFDHLYHWSSATLRDALRRAGFEAVAMHRLRGYRSEGKKGLLFRVIYALSEMVASALSWLSAERWDFWPVLLAGARKPTTPP